jgi:hypothetical protein
MKQKEVFKKIGGIIQELNDQYEYLQTATDDLNDLELELFVSNAHFLTDHIEILCKLNLQKGSVKRVSLKPESSSEKKYFEPVVQSMKPADEINERMRSKTELKEETVEVTDPIEPEERPVPEIDLTSGTPEDTYSFIRDEEPQTIRHELVIDEAMAEEDETLFSVEEAPEEAEIEGPIVEDIVTTEHGPEIEGVKPTKKAGNETKNQAAADDEVLTVNQRMSAQRADKAGKAEQLSLKPIGDINLAITLNDKLLYVKDLFNGYNLAYSEAIQILNRFDSFEEAARFLKTNYVTKNNWESKPATTGKFYALLKRRYA